MHISSTYVHRLSYSSFCLSPSHATLTSFLTPIHPSSNLHPHFTHPPITSHPHLHLTPFLTPFSPPPHPSPLTPHLHLTTGHLTPSSPLTPHLHLTTRPPHPLLTPHPSPSQVRSMGALLKFLDKHRVGVELEDTSVRIPVIAIKPFTLYVSQ